MAACGDHEIIKSVELRLQSYVNEAFNGECNARGSLAVKQHGLLWTLILHL